MHFSGSMLESKGKETCRQRNGCRLIVVIGSVIVAVNDCQVRVKLVGEKFTHSKSSTDRSGRLVNEQKRAER